MKKIIAILALCCWAVGAGAQNPPPGTPAFQETLATRATLEALRQGGYVLYMRHGNTDNSRPDRAPQVDLNDCSTQRPLNEEGRRVTAEVGRAIRQARIPLGEIFVSPLCRAKESAQAAFGKDFQVHEQLMYTANLTSEQKKPILATTRKLLSEPVPAGVNRVIVAHAPNMADLMGFFVKPEGTVVVIRPRGNGEFEYVASIHPRLWPELLR